METISLSKRGYTVLKRWVETKFEKALETAKEATEDVLDGNGEIFQYNKNWRLELNYCCAYHIDGCRNEGEDVVGEQCDHCDPIPLMFCVDLSYTNHDNNTDWKCFEQGSWRARTLKIEVLLSWLDWVQEKKNKWTLCRCGHLATMNGVCDKCYIHSYVRSEEEGGDCCVCHENDGRWDKLECGHILHNHCFFNILLEAGFKRKCPLCRQLSKFPISYDCYDV
jgi:hypothetical protein